MVVVEECGSCSQSALRLIKDAWNIFPKRYSIEKKYRLKARPIRQISNKFKKASL